MYDRDDKIPSIKLASVQYVILLVIGILVVRLWNLQVRGSERYLSLADQNRIRKIPILAPRGKIYDREGRDLVPLWERAASNSSTTKFLSGKTDRVVHW